MPEPQLIPAQATGGMIGGPNLAGVSVYDAAGNQRVVLGQISSAPDYGLKVVAADGTTVIIDGASDVFKISASGTMTHTFAASPPTTNSSTNLVLSSLGTQSVIPASLGFISNGNTNADQRTPGWFLLRQTEFVSTTSGGAVTHSTGTLVMATRLNSYLDGSNLVNLDFGGDSFDIGVATIYCRYYVLAEAAL